MRTRKTFGGESEATEINISPLIDMVFILLIFFIVTTVFVEEDGMQVNRPEPAPVDPDRDKEPVVFTVTNNGEIMFQGQALGAGGVTATVRRMLQREQLPVIVDVEQRAITNLLVRVIDEARIGGAENISLTSSN